LGTWAIRLFGQFWYWVLGLLVNWALGHLYHWLLGSWKIGQFDILILQSHFSSISELMTKMVFFFNATNWLKMDLIVCRHVLLMVQFWILNRGSEAQNLQAVQKKAARALVLLESLPELKKLLRQIKLLLNLTQCNCVKKATKINNGSIVPLLY
jgi:hypothetical protein